MVKYIANTFQTPNAHVDEIMTLLTGDQYKVLSFATRHINGWHDRPEKYEGRIALSIFVDGFVTPEGTRYGGCGLNRNTVIEILDQLVTFGLLVRVGEPTQDGQKWTLGKSPNLELITSNEKTKKRTEANKRRAEKMNEARRLKRQAVSSDEPPQGVSCDEPPVSCDEPPGVSCDDTHINTCKTHAKESVVSDETHSQSQETEKKPRTARQRANDEASAMLIKALGDAWGAQAVKADEKDYLIIARKLVQSNVPMSEFKWFVTFQKRKAAEGNYKIQTIWGLVANGRISNYVAARDAYRAEQESGKVRGPWQGAGDTEVTAQYHQTWTPDTATAMTEEEHANQVREVQAQLELLRSKKARAS